MKKIIIACLALLVGMNISLAKDVKVSKKDFNNVINNSEIDKSSISVSLKELNTGKTVYALNEQILRQPASVQKVLTLIPAIEVLGDDYEFTTAIYKRGDDSFIIKLGADPYLNSSNLKSLVKNITPETEKVYIDNSILEDKSWGEGWQWDDDLNVLMPHFNSYNLDKNITKITIMPTNKGELATIINPSKYPLVFLNNVVTDKTNDIKISRDNSISSNTLSLNGTVDKPQVISIPTNNLKRYFNIRLKNTLGDRNIYLKQNFIVDNITNTDEKVGEVTHPISQAIPDILQNSNNMISETISKLAGAKAYQDKGTDLYAIKVFEEYCKRNNLDITRIRLADASGVSKNNLVTTDFITEFLLLNKNNEILKSLPTPGVGTLTHRMLPIQQNLRAKTGTLSDISSIAGFLTTKKGKKYVFSIIINDPSVSTYEMKTLEDYLIREIYLHL